MKKYLPYIIIGVPLLLGGFLLVRAMGKKEEEQDLELVPEDTKGSDDIFAPTPSTGSTFVDTGVESGTSGQTGSTSDFPLKIGSRSEYVKVVQRKLGGLVDDGIFGTKTEAKVKEFQKSRNLTPDGVVGALTWKAFFGVDFPRTMISNLGGLPNNPYATTKFPVNNSTFGF
jgi:hypothetical protein